MRAGFPHSEICGSKLVCQLPAAYRRLLRPSSPVIAKASTTCTYSLDPITLPTNTVSVLIRGQASVMPQFSQFKRTSELLCICNHNPYLVKKTTYDIFFQIVKEQPLTRRVKGKQPLVAATCASRLYNTETTPELVEVNGIEPMTPCLQSRCSPS